jgi:hypothetical protein
MLECDWTQTRLPDPIVCACLVDQGARQIDRPRGDAAALDHALHLHDDGAAAVPHGHRLWPRQEQPR